MKQVILFFIVGLLLFAIGCASNKFHAEQTLRNLRASLNLLKNAPVDEPFEAPRYDVSSLVGISRGQIESSLGVPKQCGDSWMPAPCENKGDWYYSFYKFPEYNNELDEFWIGGGPELLLQFGDDNICTSAKWIITQ